MTPTLEHGYYERRNGRKTLRRGKTINGVDNPWVGQEFGEWQRAAREHCPENDAWYAIAWLIEERGDELLDELAEVDDETLREAVVEIEARRSGAKERQEDKSRLSEMVEDADPAQLKAMADAAEEAKETVDTDDPLVHEDAINRGSDD